MRAFVLAFAVAFLASALPWVDAHGIVFSADPTAFNLDGFLATDKTIQLSSGAPGAIYFAEIPPGSAATPLDFALRTPLRMNPHGADVQIALRADKPVVTQDANGNSIRVELLANGTPIPGAKAEGALPLKLGPDEPSGFHASLPTNVTAPIDENATIILRITPLMPALLDQALAVIVGGDAGSTLNFPLFNVPTVQDLHLQDTDLYQYDISRANFTPPNASRAVNEIDVFHTSITTNYVNVFGTRAYLVFKGAEPSNDAQEFHMFVQRDRRMNSTHDLLVGNTRVRVYPGVGVVVDLDVSAGATLLKCVQNCPSGGFQMTISPNRINQKPGDAGVSIGATPNATSGGSSAAIPPPSAHASSPTPTKSVPGVPLAAMLVLAGTFAFARRRR